MLYHLIGGKTTCDDRRADCGYTTFLSLSLPAVYCYRQRAHEDVASTFSLSTPSSSLADKTQEKHTIFPAPKPTANLQGADKVADQYQQLIIKEFRAPALNLS